MHMTITAIVYATTKQGAINKAEDIFEHLCGDYKPFDYFSIFKDDVLKATEAWAADWLKEAMRYTKEEFLRHLGAIKQFLAELSEEDLWNDKKIPVDKQDPYVYYDFRYSCHSIGEYRGPSVRLYDNDGEGIRTEDHLERTLKKWPREDGTSPYDDQPNLMIWVVPADVHF